MPIIRGVKGALAQLGERNTGSVEVSGSIPLGSTIPLSTNFSFDSCQTVFKNLIKFETNQS